MSDVSRPAPPPPPAAPDASGDLDARLRRDFEGRANVLTAADVGLAPDASGVWRTPRGARVTTTVRVGLSRPAEVDGVPFTAYHAADEGQYWVHEGGGLSGTDRWYGPFPLR